MPNELENNTPKEVDVFRKYSRHNKLIIVAVAILIASILVTSLYFFIKSLLTYTVTFELNGGYVYGVEDNTLELKFLDRVYTPFAKKKGYYLDTWCEDKELTKEFKEGTMIWNDMTLYARWEKGYAVLLNFAPGEENEDLPLIELQMKYEQYVKLGESWTLPLIFNENKNSVHYGEQLLWYDNPECTGKYFDTKTFHLNKEEDIPIYGKWFDTKQEKFDVDENGTLNKYLGRCRNIILPDNIERIRGIEYNNFRLPSDQPVGQESHSVFMNVMYDENHRNSLNSIYLNKNLKEIGECAFRLCRSLNSVYFLGDKVETIGKSAFEGCESLVNINLPSSLTTIPESCFKGAFNYVEGDEAKQAVIEIPSSITTIEKDAFYGSKVSKVILNNVRHIDKTAFGSCRELRVFEIRTQAVIESNADGSEIYPIFCDGTVSNNEYSNKLKIYVLPEFLDLYKTTAPWSKFVDFIKTK